MKIAIVGRGGVFPGAANLEEFWQNIESGRDMAQEAPAARWTLPLADVYSPHIEADKVISKRACFVKDFSLDLTGCNLGADLLRQLDISVQILLAAGIQAYRDGVTAAIDKSRMGVIVGNIVLPTEKTSALAVEQFAPAFEHKVWGTSARATAKVHPLNAFSAGLPAGLLAQTLGLGASCFTLDAACASSIYAIKLAAEELLAGRADAMLAGGVSRPDSFYTQMGFSQLQALSPSGKCSPFDRKGNGLVVGEGAGIFLLKRLADALRSGDRIYATIEGIGLANDVQGTLLSPDSEGQLRAMRQAYLEAGWIPRDVELIECHATGTPLGDRIEFASMRELWRQESWQQGQCVIGSVKSNIGHLLTAAGAAGLMKILFALEKKVLPPTANFESPAESISLRESPFCVLSQARVWERTRAAQPRRAAVSAFGFGGINGHMLLQAWEEPVKTGVSFSSPREKTDKADTVAAQSPIAIAIVGMDCQVGPWKGLRAFQEQVLVGKNHEATLLTPLSRGIEQLSTGDNKKFSGHYLSKIEIPPGKFRIPPKELEESLPQQILMLDVSHGALQDSGLEIVGLRCGVFIGIALDLNTTNFHFRWHILNRARQMAEEKGMSSAEAAKWIAKSADMAGPPLTANRTMGALGGIVASRIARQFRIGGPSFTISSEDTSGLKAMEVAIRFLERKELDYALVGAVDFPGDWRMLTAAKYRAYGNPDGWKVAEGAGALVLRRLEDAKRDGNKIYAVIAGMGAVAGKSYPENFDTEAYFRVLQKAYQESGSHSASAGYLEASALGLQDAGKKEREILQKFFAADGYYALGNVKKEIGHAGAASGLMSLLKAVLVLQQNMLPGWKDADRQPIDMPDRFYFPADSQYWLHNRAAGPRHAGVSSFGVDGNYLHVILQESPLPALAKSLLQPLGERTEVLLALSAASLPEMHALIQYLERIWESHGQSSLETFASIWWQEHQAHFALSLAILLRRGEDLLAKTRLIRNALSSPSEENLSLLRKERIFYTPVPLGKESKIAFVFPGSGNHYVGMGRNISVAWPELFREHEQTTLWLREQFWNFSRNQEPDCQSLIFGQVALGILLSDLVRKFNIHPHAVIGYSLGESTSLFAMRVWSDRDEMFRRMKNSTLFTEDLAGPCKAIRKIWGVAPQEKIVWVVGMVDKGVAEVKKVLSGKPRVYLLIVNTLSECVIGGDERAVQAAVAELKCNYLPLSGIATVHCEALEAVKEAYWQLHYFPLHLAAAVELYSAAWAIPYAATSEKVADSILAQAVSGFDFPKLLEHAYARGYRIFLEMGPGYSCTRAIQKILADRPHLAVSACYKETDEASSVLALLGNLIAQGVKVDLGFLYGEQKQTQCRQEKPRQEATIRISVAGQPLHAIPLPKYTEPVSLPLQQTKLPAVPATIAHNLLPHIASAQQEHALAHERYLQISRQFTQNFAQALLSQMKLLAHMAAGGEVKKVAYDRSMCMEFAVGSIAKVFGDKFAEIVRHPTRVRLPAEPLMLVDRILTIEGEPGSMLSGRVVTEHDIHDNAWYLDEGKIPTCIAVEAGQADLLLSGYLGIDFQTKGLAMYRLLDAEITFHQSLPTPGKTVQYDIHIAHFFNQGESHLFRFRFEGSVDGRPLLSMKKGCAGFFTRQALDAGQGIVHSKLDLEPAPGKLPADWKYPTSMAVEFYDEKQIKAIYAGNLEHAFGPAFKNFPSKNPVTLPPGFQNLIHRVTHLDPAGGRYGIGIIRSEADIRPDDWFLTCHFVDDMVMPGTLMYECCMHTLRIFLLRMGWIAERGKATYEPVPGVSSQLKCRGQVIPSTRQAAYEVTIKEMGYRPEPYVIADAILYSDGKAIVKITNMSLQMSGVSQEEIRNLWEKQSLAASAQSSTAAPYARKPALFDNEKILAFAIGKPSAAFGEPYQIFDAGRVIARLPGPPYKFLDRITEIHAQAWKMTAGGSIEAQYDVPRAEWYFDANGGQGMPFAVLLEIALQPCGWFAAYLGSALMSESDLSFRNLGGQAVQYLAVPPEIGTLTTKIEATNISHSGGMIIQHYDMEMAGKQGLIYKGNTYFGFFSKAALANQVGLQGVKLYVPSETEMQAKQSFSYPASFPFPEPQLRMVDQIDIFLPKGGPQQMGFIQGSKLVNPTDWFFQAHFYQDPVWPGSLGLESCLQLLKVWAAQRWGITPQTRMSTVALNKKHTWVYRGQVIPKDHKVTVQAVITQINEAERLILADGYLVVDNRIIYQMKDFSLQML